MSTAVQPTSAVPPGAQARLLGSEARRRAAGAAALSLGAAWVHLAYAAPHLRQWWAYGAFFVATGVGQALFAPLILRRPTRGWLVAVAVAGNVAIIAMYVVSRTYGPPLGPHARVPEPAGPVDLATSAAEVCLVGVLLTLMAPRARRFTANLLVAFAALVWALRLRRAAAVGRRSVSARRRPSPAGSRACPTRRPACRARRAPARPRR